jgi:hypothetical protein
MSDVAAPVRPVHYAPVADAMLAAWGGPLISVRRVDRAGSMEDV